MRITKKIHKWVEAINTYYGFGVTVYAIILYIAGNSRFFFWVFVATTPFIAGWTGYVLRSYIEQRNQRHGFRLLSDSVAYEIQGNKSYKLRFSTKIKAAADHLGVYPMGYKWSGQGKEGIPKVTGKGQHLLTLVQRGTKQRPLAIVPYRVTATEGEWRYWFIAINPPVHTGDVVEVKYTQEFYDSQDMARPHLRYFVRVPMNRLELSVKFPPHNLPKTVAGSYIKPSDPSRPYAKSGVTYDPDKQWATWVIKRPKKGYCYKIQWH